jgi:uncharacterized membrane protein YraQ (UPF0718 family)
MFQNIQFKGKTFLYIMVVIYIGVYFFDSIGTIKAFLKTIEILTQIWPLFLFIIFLTTLINYFLKPKHIIKHFGEDSGKRGIFYALLAGIISHGPMYVWYGLLEELREKGVKDELLIIFFYARAIKIPMIPFSIAVFGTPFTLIISLYILIFAVIQGKVFSFLWNKGNSKN